jgi:hypothetical protein
MRWNSRQICLLGALALFGIAAVMACSSPIDPNYKPEGYQPIVPTPTPTGTSGTPAKDAGKEASDVQPIDASFDARG